MHPQLKPQPYKFQPLTWSIHNLIPKKWFDPTKKVSRRGIGKCAQLFQKGNHVIPTEELLSLPQHRLYHLLEGQQKILNNGMTDLLPDKGEKIKKRIRTLKWALEIVKKIDSSINDAAISLGNMDLKSDDKDQKNHDTTDDGKKLVKDEGGKNMTLTPTLAKELDLNQNDFKKAITKRKKDRKPIKVDHNTINKYLQKQHSNMTIYKTKKNTYQKSTPVMLISQKESQAVIELERKMWTQNINQNLKHTPKYNFAHEGYRKNVEKSDHISEEFDDNNSTDSSDISDVDYDDDVNGEDSDSTFDWENVD